MKTINITMQIRGSDENIDEMVSTIQRDRKDMMANPPEPGMTVLRLDQLSDYVFEVEIEVP